MKCYSTLLCEHEERDITHYTGERTKKEAKQKQQETLNRNTMKDSESENNRLPVTVRTRGSHRATLPATLQPAQRHKKLCTNK